MISVSNKLTLMAKVLVTQKLFFTAGSVLRMFEYALGEDTFKQAVNLYLSRK